MRRLLLVIAVEVAAVRVTHTLSAPYRSSLDLSWIARADLGMLLLAVAHLAAWVAVWWLLLGTVHDVVATIITARHRGRARGVAAAPAWVRRIIHQAIGTALLVSVTAGPVGALSPRSEPATVAVAVVQPPVPAIGATAAPVVAPVISGPSPVQGPVRAEPTAPPTAVEAPNDTVHPGMPPASPAADGTASDGTASVDTASDDTASDDTVEEGAGPDDAEPHDAAADGADAEGAAAHDGASHREVHVVASGENLWVIAKAVLVQRLDSVPTDRQTHAYWVRLIQANDVRSGDPDLIYPGERLSLPADPLGQG